MEYQVKLFEQNLSAKRGRLRIKALLGTNFAHRQRRPYKLCTKPLNGFHWIPLDLQAGAMRF